MFYSIVLMAVVDAAHRFLIVDVGANGRSCDAGIFGNSAMSTTLENGTLIYLSPEKSTMVTNACIVLHNFLLTRNDVRHNNGQTDSGAGILQRIGQQEGEGNRNYDEAREIRDEFCDYFNTNGAVEWQWSIPM